MKQIQSSLLARLPTPARHQLQLLKRRIKQALGAPRAHERPGVVLMLHVGRCGSTVLANQLKQDEDIFWDAKLHRKARTLYGERFRDMDHAPWLKRQFTMSGPRFYGFEYKVLEDQYSAKAGLSTREFMDHCEAMGVTHYILLVRKNTLRHVISHAASKNRGSWHFQPGDVVSQEKFELNLDSISTGSSPGRPLLDYLREVDAAHAQIRDWLADDKLLELSYETDINEKGPQFAYDRICSFLGKPARNVEIKNKKANVLPIEDTLLNTDAVADLLKGTEFEWMLDDE